MEYSSGTRKCETKANITKMKEKIRLKEQIN
jgi:hypothetical protein